MVKKNKSLDGEFFFDGKNFKTYYDYLKYKERNDFKLTDDEYVDLNRFKDEHLSKILTEGFLEDFDESVIEGSFRKSKNVKKKVRSYVCNDKIYATNINTFRYDFVLMPAFKGIKELNRVIYDKRHGWKCNCMNFKVNKNYCSHIIACKIFFNNLQEKFLNC